MPGARRWTRPNSGSWRSISISSLLLLDDEFDASILGQSVRIVPLRQRTVGAIALRREPIRFHAPVDEILPHTLGALLTELQVAFTRPGLVGMPFDADPLDLRVGPHRQ